MNDAYEDYPDFDRPREPLSATPITACYYCPRRFSDEAARWQHMHDIHGVGADERLRLTQGALEARHEFMEVILQAQAKRMAEGR